MSRRYGVRAWASIRGAPATRLRCRLEPTSRASVTADIVRRTTPRWSAIARPRLDRSSGFVDAQPRHLEFELDSPSDSVIDVGEPPFEATLQSRFLEVRDHIDFPMARTRSVRIVGDRGRTPV